MKPAPSAPPLTVAYRWLLAQFTTVELAAELRRRADEAAQVAGVVRKK